MVSNKFAEYFVKITENKNVKHDPKMNPVWGTATPPLIWDKRVYAKAPIHTEVIIVHKAGECFGGGGPAEGIIAGKSLEDLPMVHPCDEIIIFSGTDPGDPEDLGGEVEYWIGEGEQAEKYVINKSTSIYVPKETVHMPIYFARVDRPFMLFAILLAPEWFTCYTKILPPAFKHIKNKK